ncbi:MAG TPA: sulfatase-like hydrolase/transferase [Dongiaceae bacterium]
MVGAHAAHCVCGGGTAPRRDHLGLGHFPYALNQEKRPYRAKAEPTNGLLTGYINCSYYTSRAVEAYVAALRAIDPDAIIVVLGDHPPGLPGLPRQITYPRPVATRFDVPLLIYNGQKGAIDLTGRVPGYAIPGIVADLLTDGEYCRHNRCFHLEPVAARPLAHGLLAIDRADDEVVDCAENPQAGICRTAQHFSDGAKLGLFHLVGME